MVNNLNLYSVLFEKLQTCHH